MSRFHFEYFQRIGKVLGKLEHPEAYKAEIMTTELYIEIRKYLRDFISDTEWEDQVYAVGGCCRDELMDLPIKDVDMAVNLCIEYHSVMSDGYNVDKIMRVVNSFYKYDSVNGEPPFPQETLNIRKKIITEQAKC